MKEKIIYPSIRLEILVGDGLSICPKWLESLGLAPYLGLAGVGAKVPLYLLEIVKNAKRVGPSFLLPN